MKKTVLFFGTMLAALVFAGCNQNADGNQGQNTSHKAQTGRGDFTTPVPASKGIDEFAGKKFMQGENVAYEFSNDGMVQSYNTNQVGFDEEQKAIIVTEKGMKYAYSYNSEEKSLTLVPRCFYYNDEPYYTSEEYVNAWTNNGNGNTYSAEYVNLYKKLDNDWYAKTPQKFLYSFESNGKEISLSPVVGTKLKDTSCSFNSSVQKEYKFYVEKGGEDTYKYKTTHFDMYYSLNPNWISLSINSTFGWKWFAARLIDLTDSEAKIVFTDSKQNNDTINGGTSTYEDYVVGYAKLTYKITKESDTKGKIKCSITDFDDNLKKYFKDMFASFDYSNYDYSWGDSSTHNKDELINETYSADNYFNDFMEYFKDFELTTSENNSAKYTVIGGNTKDDSESDYEINDSEVPVSVNSISLSDGEWLFCRIENGLISYSSNSYKEIGESKVYYKVTMNQGKATVTYGKATQNTTIEGSLSEYLKKYPEASEYITDGNKLKGSKELTKQEELNTASTGFQEMLDGINDELSSLAGNGVSVKTNTAQTKYKIYSAYEKYGEQTEEIWYFVKK